MVWFAEYTAARSAGFDPEEGALHGVRAAGTTIRRRMRSASHATYGLVFGEHRDVIGRLDPATGKVVEFPMPYTDNGMRDFFLDNDGRFWYGSPPNNKVGYFYISTRQRSAAAR